MSRPALEDMIEDLRRVGENRWDDHNEDHKILNETLKDNEVDIGIIKSKLKEYKQKPLDKVKLVSFIFGALVVLLTAMWSLSAKLTERPTIEQMDHVISEHADKPIQDIRNEQNNQHEMLNRINDTIHQMSNDVHEIRKTHH